MRRQNVYELIDDGYNPITSRVVGWFDRDQATEIEDRTWWNDTNHVSLATGSQWARETLWITKAGRYVLEWWQGESESWEFVSPDRAREWLIKNEYDSEYIGELLGEPMAEESGPTLGRPAIGPKVKISLPEDLLARIDALADGAGLSRAAWIRAALAEAAK